MSTASVERTLGLILGRLDGIDKSMAKADESRARLHTKFETLEEKLDETEAAAKDAAKRITAIEPTVADINRWRERGIGAWLLVIGLSAFLGGAISKVMTKLWTLLAG